MTHLAQYIVKHLPKSYSYSSEFDNVVLNRKETWSLLKSIHRNSTNQIYVITRGDYTIIILF